jgi:hypothetical protein
MGVVLGAGVACADAKELPQGVETLLLAQAESSADALFGLDQELPSEKATGEAMGPEQPAGSKENLFGLEQDEPAAAEPGRPEDAAESLFGIETQDDTPAPEERSWSDRISGFFQNEMAYAYPGDGHWSSFRSLLQLEAVGRLGPNVSWKASGRLTVDPVFDRDNFYPSNVASDQRFEGQVRDTYLDVAAGDFEFRFGRQSIIWGETPGVFVADVVTAKDLRQFIVQDFELLRIPQYAVNAEYFSGDFFGQLLWIPYPTVDDIGVPGAEFYPAALANGYRAAGTAVSFGEETKPRFGLSNSGLGARASYLKSGWDGALFYYTSIDARSAFRRDVLPGPTAAVLLTPVHERVNQVGGTLTKDFEAGLLRMEAVYSVDRLTETLDPTDANGLSKEGVLDWIVGFEWNLAGETRVNAQFFQRWYPDHRATFVEDELDSGVTILLNTKAFHSDITPEVLWIRTTNRNDWLLQAKVSWEFEKNAALTVGADIFEGEPDGPFGQYDDNDRIYYELRLDF